MPTSRVMLRGFFSTKDELTRVGAKYSAKVKIGDHSTRCIPEKCYFTALIVFGSAEQGGGARDAWKVTVVKGSCSVLENP